MWGHQNQSLHTLATYIDYLMVLCHHHFKKENFAVDPHLSVATKLVTVFIKVIDSGLVDLYTLTSLFIFSILFSMYFFKC